MLITVLWYKFFFLLIILVLTTFCDNIKWQTWSPCGLEKDSIAEDDGEKPLVGICGPFCSGKQFLSVNYIIVILQLSSALFILFYFILNYLFFIYLLYNLHCIPKIYRSWKWSSSISTSQDTMVSGESPQENDLTSKNTDIIFCAVSLAKMASSAPQVHKNKGTVAIKKIKK